MVQNGGTPQGPRRFFATKCVFGFRKRDGALADPVPCLWCHSPCRACRSAAAAAAVVVAVIAAPAAPAAAIAAQQEQDDDGDDDPPAARRTLIAHIY